MNISVSYRSCFCCYRLESQVDAQSHGAWRGGLGIVHSLHERTVGIGEFGVESEVVGQAEQVLSCRKDGSTLNEVPDGLVPGIAQGDVTQFDISCILYPSVAESIVAHAVVVAHTRHVGVLSLHEPAAVDRRSLVGKVLRRLRYPPHRIVGIVAESIGEGEVEGEVPVFEPCEE